MQDIRLFTARALLPVTALAPVRGFLPPSIVARGRNFALASEIYYNGTKVSQFIIQSINTVLIAIPESQIGQPFTGLVVYASSPLNNADASVDFSIPAPIRLIEGMERLVQAWLLIFFTSPGSSIFAPNSGGGGLALVGRNTDTQGKGIAADFALGVKQTESELLSLQTQLPAIPPIERLMSSDLQTLSFNPNTSALQATVLIKNSFGTAAGVSLGGSANG